MRSGVPARNIYLDKVAKTTLHQRTRKKEWDPLGLELEAVLNHLRWVFSKRSMCS